MGTKDVHTAGERVGGQVVAQTGRREGDGVGRQREGDQVDRQREPDDGGSMYGE